MRFGKFLILVVSVLLFSSAFAREMVVDFETAEIGVWIPSWEEQGVTFGLAWKPTKSKAAGSLVFFPHLATGHTGILCAMADEPIPVEARLPQKASKVTIRFWASTGSAAKLEAFDEDDSLVDTDAIGVVPARGAPGEPVPFFELIVAGEAIAYVRFSGPREGEFLAADELRYAYADD
jgi:hypothetical protein